MPQQAAIATAGDLAASKCVSITFLAGTLADGSKAGRKIRISGRLWMNGMDAPATVSKESAGRHWQAEADLAAIIWSASPLMTNLHQHPYT